MSRRGDKVDEFISEAVSAKLEQRSATAAENIGPGEADLRAVEEQIRELGTHWQRKISSSIYFEQLPCWRASETGSAASASVTP